MSVVVPPAPLCALRVLHRVDRPRLHEMEQAAAIRHRLERRPAAHPQTITHRRSPTDTPGRALGNMSGTSQGASISTIRMTPMAAPVR